MGSGGLGPWLRGLRFWEGSHRIAPEGKENNSSSSSGPCGGAGQGCSVRPFAFQQLPAHPDRPSLGPKPRRSSSSDPARTQTKPKGQHRASPGHRAHRRAPRPRAEQRQGGHQQSHAAPCVTAPLAWQVRAAPQSAPNRTEAASCQAFGQLPQPLDQRLPLPGSLSHGPASPGTLGNVEPGAEPCRGEAEPPPPGAAVPGQPQVCCAAAGKEPSGEAIRCEEKPISCCKGCFAQRFAKCADATALRRWDINTRPVDVDSCPTATQTLLAMFSLEGKRNTRGTALTTKSLPVEAGRLGLQEAGKALPWAQRSAEAASILGH